MSYKICQVNTRAELKKWVRFPFSLYGNTPNYVPQLQSEEMKFFTKNPALKVTKTKFFYVTDGKNIVGRVGGVIHSLEVEKLGRKRGRFGWFECIDNGEVARLLLDAVTSWLKEELCVEVTGPHGFTDLDQEGLLVEGFDELPPVTGNYHMPYYKKLIEEFGFVKDVDYIEHKIKVPASFPLYERLRPKLLESSGYKLLELKSIKALTSYLPKFWETMESSYEHLYGVTPLTEEQKRRYEKDNLSMLDPDFVKIVLDKDDELVGFFLGMPNLSSAFQKAKGKLFPFGLLHILKEYKKTKTVDFLLIGVRPGVPNKNVMMLMMGAMHETLRARGIEFMESNRQLETNFTIADVWKRFDSRLHRRSRMYRLEL